MIEKREGEPIWKKSISAVYYKFVNWLTNDLIPRDVNDFRLIDRRVAIAMNRLGENNRFTCAMSVWSGFSVAGVKFIRPPRYAGESKAPLGDLIEEGLNGIFSFSVAPLRLTLFTGFMFALITVIFGIYQLLATFLWGANFPGYLTLVFINLIVASLLFTMLGIYGEYLAKIFLEVKGRPNFIIWDTVGLAPLPSPKCMLIPIATGAQRICQTGWKRWVAIPSQPQNQKKRAHDMSNSLKPADIPVMILCGGKGTRIGSVSETLPKPMLPIGNHPIV